jgi:hypothetical protein
LVRFLSYILLLAILGALALGGCKKQSFITDPSAGLEFSSDTLYFDTVFTTIGSSTRLFKVFNPHSRSIRIERILLAGGNASSFRINIDGISGTEVKDIDIAPRDSLYIFAEVTVDPNADNNPFLITDSVLFLTNGNLQSVVLAAYGQNAYFHLFEEICNETWNNDKPHVILGNILVDTNCTLTLTQGVRVYVHADANILVAGSLHVLGTADSVVTFEGDRLESFFDDLPGQWGQIIILRGSSNNIIRHAVISEATSGIVIGSTTSNNLDDFHSGNLPDVTIEQTVIRSCRDYGIFSFFSNVTASNTLVYDIGRHNVALFFGGTHRFTHCTLANYGALGLDHKQPVFKATNYALQTQTDIRLRPGDVELRNSIIYGNILMDTSARAGEIDIDTIAGATPFRYVFDHCLMRTNYNTSGPEFISPITNAEPRFIDVTEKNYGLQNNSPAINAGNPAWLIATDLFGTDRQGSVDLGAVKGGE